MQVYVDTVGDAGKYEARLSREVPGVKFTVCPKADSIYPIVSAASIAAKVTRDTMQGAIAGETGSGYPGDAVTKAWLAARFDPVFGFPADVRCASHQCDCCGSGAQTRVYMSVGHCDSVRARRAPSQLHAVQV